MPESWFFSARKKKRTQYFIFNCTDQTIPDFEGFYLETLLTFRFSSTLFCSLISGERQTMCSSGAQISLTDWACAVLVLILCLKAERLFPQSEQPWTIRGADTFICRPPSLAGIHNPSVMTDNYTRRLQPVAFKWLYDHFSEACQSKTMFLLHAQDFDHWTVSASCDYLQQSMH